MEGDIEVVGLGMACLDVLLRLQEMPTWDQGTRIKAFGFDGGGPVGTAIVASARLGARAGFIGTAGSDEAAELKMKSLAENGVDLSRMVYREAPEDQIVVVHVHAETGERLFSGVERWGESQLRVEELDREYITAAEYLHLDGFHAEAAKQAAAWMREAGKKVVLDGHKTTGEGRGHMRDLVEQTDVLISGSGFARGLTGIDDIREAGEKVLEMGPEIFVQTEGEKGSYTVTDDEFFHLPAFAVEAVDTTGAGDVFHGAYIAGLLRGWDLRQIAIFSTAVSAIKCTKLGGRGGIPRFDEVIAFLEEHDILFD